MVTGMTVAFAEDNQPAREMTKMHEFGGLRRQLGHLLALGVALGAVVSCDGGSKNRQPGQTDFTTLDNGGGLASVGGDRAGTAAPGAANSAAAPSGRTGTVQEADIYRLVGTRLYYFNTFRGFIVYDVTDAANPTMVSRLPVYGYPVEMFVEGNTVYALLRDSLYLTQVGGQMQFQRHYVSQLVTIDVTNPASPSVLGTLDIIGELHEGVARKIDNTIYVVSEQFGSYYWGWYTPDVVTTNQAWVYSYDVSDPQHPRQAGQLQIFDGGDMQTNTSGRSFGGVTISATSNALMVVENWYGWSNATTPSGCSWSNTQDAVVSLVDISDPTGTIRVHTRFQTSGSVDDQFKMTYRFDDATQRGTFFGIFATQSWGGCSSSPATQNTLESWDVTNGAAPQKLAALDFGDPGETVAASTFDVTRNIAYAVTSRQIDPLYAIDITDPAAPRVLSSIGGLSGSISVFRTVGDGQFLLGVGTDNSGACVAGTDATTGWTTTQMAVTLVDARNPANLRLVQRRCVSIQNAEWTWSSINWNLDQAHKMLGMLQDGDLNLLTVPISYYVRTDLNVGWWNQWKTAVGLMSWDLSRYDDTKPPEQQTVIQSYGAFVHPQGEVTRSILFRHPATNARTMINLSDTHLSVANIDNLAQPALQSIVEVAPQVNEVFGFGNYLVERVERGTAYYTPDSLAEFRVKAAGADIDDAAPVATFQIGQATSAYPFKQNLIVFRAAPDPANGPYASTTEIVVYDLSDPTHPQLASRTTGPFQTYSYWGFFCGVGLWGGYWFGNGENTIVTDAGLAQVRMAYNTDGAKATTYTPHIEFLDLRNPRAPVIIDQPLDDRSDYGWYSLVADPTTPSGFYLNWRDVVGQEPANDGTGVTFTRYRDYAQRWEMGPGGLTSGDAINIPGPLARAWSDRGTQLFLTREWVYRTLQFPDHMEWHGDTRLNLLSQSGAKATLLDERTFTDTSVSSLIVEGSLDGAHIYVSAQNNYYWWGYPSLRDANPPTWESTSDRLIALDLSARKLTSVYDQPTRTYGVQLMGLRDHHLFVSLPGDGVLLTDITNPAHPFGDRFVRTLGWASHIDFAGDSAYIASGNFGVFEIDLGAPPVLTD
jgi:hypothetical protein